MASLFRRVVFRRVWSSITDARNANGDIQLAPKRTYSVVPPTPVDHVGSGERGC